jgi:DNA-binding NarL/FixJ family response regulator
MRILLADDHPLLLAGVRHALALDDDFEVVGEANHGAEVLPLVARLRPDVVLLDMRMPGGDGLANLSRIRARFPAVKVVMCSVDINAEHIQAAFKRGACGYVLKTVEPRDLASAIRQAVDRTAYHAVGLPAIDVDSAAVVSGVTDREYQIMRAVARGLSNRAVARELWITEQTVKFHLTNIYKKLGVSNRTEAARWILDRGLIEPEDEDDPSALAAKVRRGVIGLGRVAGRRDSDRLRESRHDLGP